MTASVSSTRTDARTSISTVIADKAPMTRMSPAMAVDVMSLRGTVEKTTESPPADHGVRSDLAGTAEACWLGVVRRSGPRDRAQADWAGPPASVGRSTPGAALPAAWRPREFVNP